jgi:TonB family protein
MSPVSLNLVDMFNMARYRLRTMPSLVCLIAVHGLGQVNNDPRLIPKGAGDIPVLNSSNPNGTSCVKSTAKPRVLNLTSIEQPNNPDNIPGTVCLSYDVGPDGHAYNILVTQGITPDLDASVVKYVNQMVFTPGSTEGTHVTGSTYSFVPQPEFDRKPRMLNENSVKQPTDLGNIDGVIVVKFHIMTDGHAHSIQVTKSLTPDLDAAAVETVSNLVFEPASNRDGVSVPFFGAALTFSFQQKAREKHPKWARFAEIVNNVGGQMYLQNTCPQLRAKALMFWNGADQQTWQSCLSYGYFIGPLYVFNGSR